jgi:hypothetical protein
VRRGVIKIFLVPGDVAPIQSTLPTDDASILTPGGSCATLHAARLAAAGTATRGPKLSDVADVALPTNETAAAIQTPPRSSSNNNHPSRTPGPHI